MFNIGDDKTPEVILSDEEIQAIDDQTHFHESHDWSIRFARSVLKAAEDKKKMGNNNVLG